MRSVLSAMRRRANMLNPAGRMRTSIYRTATMLAKVSPMMAAAAMAARAQITIGALQAQTRTTAAIAAC